MKHLALAAMALLLAACPLSTSWPLGDPAQASLDGSLAGDWKAQDPESKTMITITFLAYNEREFVAFGRDPEDAHGKTDAYRAFVTVIDGEKFLNLQELGAQAGSQWSYAAYRIDGTTLTLRFVDDALFSSQTITSSDALRELVRKNLRNPALYVSDDGKDLSMKFTKAEKQ